jgi:hypothetical protein
MKRITLIELTPNYDDEGLCDATLHIEYSDGTGGGDGVPMEAIPGVLEILRRVSPIAMEALMFTWMPWEKP